MKKISKSKIKIKFEEASQVKVDVLKIYVDKVLKCIGHSEAFVTDESTISDFLDILDEEEADRQIKKYMKKLEIFIHPRDYIWEVAARVHFLKRFKELNKQKE